MIKKILEGMQIGSRGESIFEKTVKLSFDGDQFVVRIPKKIASGLKMKKGDRMKFTLDYAYLDETAKRIMVVEILE